MPEPEEGEGEDGGDAGDDVFEGDDDDTVADLRRKVDAFVGVSRDPKRAEEDILSTPQPGEVLQSFYMRTKQYWASRAFTEGGGESRGKQLRKDGFEVRYG